MFEDSTFESTGRIRTRSRGWMLATFVFNGSILLALILIPLIYPEALPRQMMSMLLEAPLPPPAPPAPPQQVTEHVRRDVSEMENGRILAPPRIPISIRMIATAEPSPSNFVPGADDLGQRGPGIPDDLFHGSSQPPVVREPARGPIHLSSGVVTGMLLHKTLPIYPAIARAARIEGTVVLQATISKAGTIENLRAISGPQVLQQAAIDAVSQWRYRAYLLNDQPVEVETTVKVVFKLNE